MRRLSPAEHEARLPAKKARRADWHRTHYEANKPRIRDNHYRLRYGITIAERDALLAEQGGVCAICKSPDPKCRNGWHLDHNHGTGVVRGVLCQTCNTGLGAIERPGFVDAAQVYLEVHRAK